MRILKKQDIGPKVVDEILAGAVFIYPTDTIYGIGCVADDDASVKRIRDIKARDKKPFSVIAPSIDWIKSHCVLSDAAKKWLLKLPGPYTLVLPLKGHCVSISANMGLNSLGVRIPDHWISNLVEKLGKPLITTSVNVSGENAGSTLLDLQRFDVDFIIFEGLLDNRPSAVVELRNGERILR